jgi:AraC-like DNA-binding protein
MQHSFPGAPTGHDGRLHAWMGRCQQLAGRVDDPDTDPLLHEVRVALRHVPNGCSLADRLIARSVINEVLARLVRRAGIDRQPDVCAAIVAVMSSCRTVDWTPAALSVIDCCARALPRQPCPRIPLVQRTLKAIEAQYHRGDIDHAAIARQMEKSAGHLHEEMMRHTGQSVATHLRRHRTGDAYRWLLETSDSIAAIALRVGLSGDVQLRRAFKREYGVPPSHVRTRGWRDPGA